MRVITGVLSCRAREPWCDAIRKTYFRRLPNPFFFRGEPNTISRRNGELIILDCPDTYEHLPRKMWRLYDYLLQTEAFDYFLKLDDDCYVQTKLLALFFERVKRERPSLTHYMGSRILNPSVARSTVWHYGKITDPAFSKEYRGAFKHSYCAGGTGYVLSRRAMQIIVERGQKQFLDEAEIYEDKCHGDVLVGAGFLPTLMPSGIVVSDLKPEEIFERHHRKPARDERKIQLGAGPNELLGWSNFDREVDLGKPLPFEDTSARYIFAEHVVEHILPKEAWAFFKECRRVLKVGGILRVTVPSVVRVAEKWTPAYLAFLSQHGWGNGNRESAVEAIITQHHHQALWSVESLRAVLNSLGFETKNYAVGESDEPELQNIEMHGLRIGEAFNRLESICIEARKIQTSDNVHDLRKVAFLFLMRSDHHHRDLWKEFFADHTGEYSVYTHAKFPFRIVDDFWKRTIIPEYISTRWGHVSLVQAMLALLANAFRDPSNEKFVILSESCVPIKPFSIIRDTLLKDSKGRMHYESFEMVNQRNRDKGKRISKAFGLPRQHWFYHGQWIALNREAASLLLDHDRTPHFEEVFAADECYVASVLSSLGCNLDQLFSGNPVTHTDWCRGKASSRPYVYESLTVHDIEQLRKSRCLFARKFAPGCNIRGVGMHLQLQ